MRVVGVVACYACEWSEVGWGAMCGADGQAVRSGRAAQSAKPHLHGLAEHGVERGRLHLQRLGHLCTAPGGTGRKGVDHGLPARLLGTHLSCGPTHVCARERGAQIGAPLNACGAPAVRRAPVPGAGAAWGPHLSPPRPPLSAALPGCPAASWSAPQTPGWAPAERHARRRAWHMPPPARHACQACVPALAGDRRAARLPRLPRLP